MKKAIEWVDTIKGDGFGHTLPSELLKLVEAVRTEALDTFELKVRQSMTQADASDDTVAVCEYFLVQIKSWRGA